MRPAHNSAGTPDPQHSDPGSDRPKAATAPVEIELKLAVSQSAREALRTKLDTYGKAATLSFDSAYFDTPDLRMAARGAALRVRRIGDGSDVRWVQTFKTEGAPGALTRRGEWESAVAAAKPDLRALADTPLPGLLQGRTSRLRKVFVTRFERTVRQVRYRDALIEVALDEGQIVAARRSEAICELELELLEGPASALFALALDLIGRGPGALALLAAFDSKAARGYRLARREPAAPMRGDAAGFAALVQPDRAPADVARHVVAHGLRCVLANVQGAAAGEDPEYVHQARVALRRIRSALRLLGAAAGANDAIVRELRWLGRVFGDMRDWDVALTHTLPSMRKAVGADDKALWEGLMQRAQGRREQQRKRLSAALDSARFARAVLCLLAWADRPCALPARGTLQGACRAIERAQHMLAVKGRDLDRLSPKARHRLRILVKRQRYAIELLAPVLPASLRLRALKPLGRLQQLLGEINDAHVARLLLASLTRSQALLERAHAWSRRLIRRTLPKVQARIERLQRRSAAA